MIQFKERPIDPTEGALWAGTTSGMMMNGIGPSPIEKEATKSMMQMLAITACESIVKESRSADRHIPLIEESRRGRRPMRCMCWSVWWILELAHQLTSISHKGGNVCIRRQSGEYQGVETSEPHHYEIDSCDHERNVACLSMQDIA